jgi:phage replication O-like protein O
MAKILLGTEVSNLAYPRSENGHTDIPNEFLEKLVMVRLSPCESSLLLYIMRKTWGWHKDTDRIPLSQFEKETRMKKPHVRRTLNKLIAKNMITQIGKSHTLTYGIQRDYEKWNVKGLPKQVIKVTRTGNKRLPNQVTSKETTKETIQKKYAETDEQFQLAKLLHDEILKRNSDFRRPNLQKWSRDIDLMIRKDKRKPKRIAEVIKWCQTNEFWQKNILSCKKLRDHFDRLELEMSSKLKWDPDLEEYYEW